MSDPAATPPPDPPDDRKPNGIGGAPVAPPAGEPAAQSGGFFMTPKGLFRKKANGDGALFVSSPFEVVARTRDASGDHWGIALRFMDMDGTIHDMTLTTEALHDATPARLAAMLGRHGLHVASKAGREALAEYLYGIGEHAKRQVSVATVGWHTIGGRLVFVLPGGTIGGKGEPVIFQDEHATENVFRTAGSLAEWRKRVAPSCEGNTRLMLAVCIALAAPLMGLVGDRGGGVHLFGKAQSGKTTALHLASSVWGGTELRGAAGYTRQWRATDNGMEGLAAAHSDTLLALDEIGQMEAKPLLEAAYMLGNGAGKQRQSRSATNRPVVTFRTMFLSTGELRIRDRAKQAKLPIMAGQEVRFVDLATDAGQRMGVFERLPAKMRDAGAFARQIKIDTDQLYGTAGPAMVAYLVTRLQADDEGFRRELRHRLDAITAEWLDGRGVVDGQVQTVARRFALAALAGELAIAADVTRWDLTLPRDHVRVCFEAWLADRGHVGAREDAQAVAQVRDYIQRYGQSRFVIWRDEDRPEAAQGNPEDDPRAPPERHPLQERSGWRRMARHQGQGGYAYDYFFTADGLRRALDGLPFRLATTTLMEQGFLIPEDPAGRNKARSLRPPGEGTMRLYEIRSTILRTGEGEE